MKKKHLALLSIILIAFGGYLIMDSYATDNVTGIHTLSMDLVIGDHMGINLDKDAVHFGTVPKGETGSITREITVSNNYGSSQEVRISAEGNLSKWLKISETTFALNPGENKSVGLVVAPSGEADYGTYRGTLKATFLKR